jgi:uncharacterized lipoprotein YmbA
MVIVSRILPILGVLCLMLTGCVGTQSSKFYMLESMSGGIPSGAGAPFDQKISVGMGPVTIPDYLDRPQIVTRTSQNSVLLAEFDRWAEPLAGTLTRTLAENLSALLHSEYVVAYPWPSSIEVSYQILVELFRFDGILGEKAILDVQWSVVGKRGKRVLLLKRSTFVEPIREASFAALVSAESRALDNLSREMASAIRDLVQERGGE